METPEQLTLRHVWEWTMPQSAGGWTLRGVSRAADATAFVIPELRWALDAGELVGEVFPREIFITHTHSDHVNRTTHLKSRRVCPGLYVPKPAAEILDHYLDAGARLSWNVSLDRVLELEPSYSMHGVMPGETYHLEHGKHGFDVDVFECHHTVPCVGYAIYERRAKLKPELIGQPGKVLGQMRAAGESIETIERIPRFAYLGDTRPSVFEATPELLEMPLVIVECSFLDDAERAASTGHTSFDELLPILQNAPEVTFVLIHVSHRHTPADLAALVREHGLDHVVVWGIE